MLDIYTKKGPSNYAKLTGGGIGRQQPSYKYIYATGRSKSQQNSRYKHLTPLAQSHWGGNIDLTLSRERKGEQ